MTDEAKALAGRLRQVSSVLFDDYADGTYAVEDHAICGKAADLIKTQARENARLRAVMDNIANESSDTWARDIARAALGESHD